MDMLLDKLRNTIKALFSPFTFRKPASFDYHGSIDEGVRTLSNHVKRTTLHAGLQDSLIGVVRHDKVRIWHYHTLGSQRGVMPVFIGRFIYKNGRTKLEGEFKLNEFSKWVFIFSILGMMSFWAYIALQDLNASSSISDCAVIIALGIAGIIILTLYFYFGWRSEKKDIEYIEDKIVEILNIRSVRA